MHSNLFLDIETNGLDPDTIWIAVTIQDGKVQEHYDKESLSLALQGDFPVVGHNLIGFDLPVLREALGHSCEQGQGGGYLGTIKAC
jgi:hypothetical protein